MSYPEITVIGKEFNTSCILMRQLLEARALPYTNIDIEFQPEYWDYVKLHKILSLPVLIIGEHWVVGFNESDVNAFIDQFYREQ